MRTDGIMTGAVVLHPGEWPSGKATDFESVYRGFESLLPSLDNKRERNVLTSTPRVATGVDWAFAPDWLTVEQACFLSGYDRLTMFAIIEEDGVDLNTEGLIEKHSLWEWQEVTVELAHWDD
jgi:hypothetical protein